MNWRTDPRNPHGSQQGFGLVSTLMVLCLMALIATTVAGLAVGERRGAFQEFVHSGAFLAADSAGEAAINWLRQQAGPAPILDWASRRVASTGTTTLRDTQRFDYGIQFVRTRPRAGYDLTHMDFVYNVDAHGQASREGDSNVEMIVSKLNKTGYQGF
jgi:hypothetical protein